MSQTALCPGCKRPNAIHRSTCIYCGAEMPAPAAPPPAKAPRELPPNFDDLVRKALSGKGTRQLEQALQDAPPLEVPRPPRPPEEPSRPARPERGAEAGAVILPHHLEPPPVAVTVQDDEEPPTEEVVDPSAALLQLWDQADAALQRWREGDLAAALAALAEAEAAIHSAREMLPSLDLQSAKVPYYQKPYALVIEGLGDQDRAGLLVDALKMDPPTARMNAISHWSRAAVRGSDRVALAQMAARARALGVAAAVMDREALLAVPSALWVLERLSETRWRVAPRPPERSDIEPSHVPGNLEVEAGAFKLAVPGEVVSRRYRGRAGSRWTHKNDAVQDLGERRVSALDLYGEGPPLRISVGVTRFEGLPGYEPGSAPRSLKNLTDRLPELFPGIRVEGKRVCSPMKTAHLETPDGEAQVDGWPLWEEHSRSCWLLHRSR